MIIEYHRTHFNSHPPTRGNPSDAGLDVYFSPKTREAVTIEPGQSVILPTGLKFGVPHGYMLEVKTAPVLPLNALSLSALAWLIQVMMERFLLIFTILAMNHKWLSHIQRLHKSL